MLCRISLVWLVSIAISSLYPAHAADLDIVGPAGSVKFGTHVVVLPNGNIVVADPSGPVANIGAVYVYSPNGSLISTLTGGSSGDLVGIGGIQVLPNGNFLVNSSRWRNPATAAANAGAVTWVNGTTGLSGVVSESNSLVGTQSLDSIGNRNATVLSNGNFVVRASEWNNGCNLGQWRRRHFRAGDDEQRLVRNAAIRCARSWRGGTTQQWQLRCV